MKKYADASLIITTYKEGGSISGWLRSLLEQDEYPSELVVVDSCSNDGTLEKVKEMLSSSGIELKLIDTKCNISEGRNIAISKACSEKILITDAGVTLSKEWVSSMTRSLYSCDIVAGYYEFDGNKWFQKAFKLLFHTPFDKLNKDTYLPSCRSMAIKKTAWKSVGGFDENYRIGEDTEFGIRLRNAGYRFGLCDNRNAYVTWTLRDAFLLLIKQQFLYSYWDGIIGQSLSSHLKLICYTFILTFGWLVFLSPSFLSQLVYIGFIFHFSFTTFRRISRKKNTFTCMVVRYSCYLSKSVGFLVGIISKILK